MKQDTSVAMETPAIYEPGHKDKMWDKIQKNPMVPLGIVGMVGMVIHGALNYRKRGSMSTSVYLMHLRVRAQSMVVGAMAIGVGISLVQEYVLHPKTKAEANVK